MTEQAERIFEDEEGAYDEEERRETGRLRQRLAALDAENQRLQQIIDDTQEPDETGFEWISRTTIRMMRDDLHRLASVLTPDKMIADLEWQVQWQKQRVEARQQTINELDHTIAKLDKEIAFLRDQIVELQGIMDEQERTLGQ